MDLPVPLRPNRAVLHGERVPGKQLADVAQERLATETELEGEVILQRVHVRLDRGEEREEGLRLRRADERSVDDRVMERLDAEAVARTEEAALGLVPDCEREHAAQVLDASSTPFAVGAQHDLGVRGRPEL